MKYKSYSIGILLFFCAVQSISQTGPGFKSKYHELSYPIKMGLCHGYHKFWMTAFDNYVSDAQFSRNVANKIAAKMQSDADFHAASQASIQFIDKAIGVDGGAGQIKAYAGVCVELGYPIGQNTGR